MYARVSPVKNEKEEEEEEKKELETMEISRGFYSRVCVITKPPSPLTCILINRIWYAIGIFTYKRLSDCTYAYVKIR